MTLYFDQFFQGRNQIITHLKVQYYKFKDTRTKLNIIKAVTKPVM